MLLRIKCQWSCGVADLLTGQLHSCKDTALLICGTIHLPATDICYTFLATTEWTPCTFHEAGRKQVPVFKVQNNHPSLKWSSLLHLFHLCIQDIPQWIANSQLSHPVLSILILTCCAFKHLSHWSHFLERRENRYCSTGFQCYMCKQFSYSCHTCHYKEICTWCSKQHF